MNMTMILLLLFIFADPSEKSGPNDAARSFGGLYIKTMTRKKSATKKTASKGKPDTITKPDALRKMSDNAILSTKGRPFTRAKINHFHWLRYSVNHVRSRVNP